MTSIKFFLPMLLVVCSSLNAQVQTYQNPVIPGFNPDPSVCRVNGDYYLVTSSFEFFPGVPVYHSKDLVHWKQIGYCLTRDSQLPLHNCPSSAGIYAPTIRYNRGVFYMVTTNVSGGGNFYVHTTDPAGDWSEPVWVKQGGIDPTLFFDEEGKTYLTTNQHVDGKTGIALSEIDLATGNLVSPIKHIWGGTGGRYPEAPHIYKINGWYYLLIAEGGTEYGHMVTIARSRNIWGPYESNADNPILTHRGLAGQFMQIQGTGHADLIEAHDGSWWMVYLAFKKTGGDFHHLGRETCLTPVYWNSEGWPEVSQDDTIGDKVVARTLPLVRQPADPARDEFDALSLSLFWNFLRNPDRDSWSLSSNKGSLTLTGNATNLDQTASPAFVGRRQQHFNCTATAEMHFDPAGENEHAGITAFMNEKHHYELFVCREGLKRYAVLQIRVGNLLHTAGKAELPEGPVQLSITADPLWYHFEVKPEASDRFITLGKMETRYLSSEVAGGFTGVYLGMYATGNGSSSKTPARFDWFEYRGK